MWSILIKQMTEREANLTRHGNVLKMEPFGFMPSIIGFIQTVYYTSI